MSELILASIIITSKLMFGFFVTFVASGLLLMLSLILGASNDWKSWLSFPLLFAGFFLLINGFVITILWI